MQKQFPYLKVILTVIGLIIGVGLYATSEIQLSTDWHIRLYTFLTIVGIFLCFTTPQQRTIKLLLGTAIVAAVFSYTWVFSLTSILLLPISLYMVFCFFYVYFEQDAWRFPYASLFVIAWNAVFILCLSLFFTMLCWGLLSLIGYLFKDIGFVFLNKLFYSSPFIYMFTSGLMGLGIAIGREHEKLISALRRILLTLCYFLLPVFCVFGIFYLILLCFGKPHTDSDMYLYFNFSLVGIFLLNGTYQLGDQPAPYSRPVRWCVNLFFFFFPIFTVMLLHDVLVMLHELGASEERYMFFMYSVMLFAYSIGYVISLVSSKTHWFSLLKKMNIFLAVMVIIFSLVLHSPLLGTAQIGDKTGYATPFTALYR